ncbi:hypothetical protein [Mangrovimonas aestuarii]|uniref:hypothetical protein n=1 Tax=Mangrovimonas aestuarii TaxID=3018443 RepID=UPI002378F137|nr:hypothetical protein [Mangrovimonas aestuarii]
MRTNNGKVKGLIVSVYFVLIVLVIIMATVFRAFKDLTPNPTVSFIVIFIGFLLLIVLMHQIAKYFEYDSDGMKVVVTNRGLLLSEYLKYREHVVEFKKENLSAFKLNDYIVYKNLVLFIEKPGKGTKKEVFDVTLVGRKKRKYIKQSLSKMIKNNIKIKNDRR